MGPRARRLGHSAHLVLKVAAQTHRFYARRGYQGLGRIDNHTNGYYQSS